MLDEKMQVWRQVGAVLAEKYNGRFHNFVKSCPPRLYDNGAGIVDRMVTEFPRFNDVSLYDGATIKIYKLPQLGIWLAYSALRKNNQFPLEDIGKMTAFADYIVPVALRLLGIVSYSTELEHAINTYQMIPRDSRQEVEIRAHCIYATALLCEEVNNIRPKDQQIIIPQDRRPPVDPLSHHVVAASSDQNDHVLIKIFRLRNFMATIHSPRCLRSLPGALFLVVFVLSVLRPTSAEAATRGKYLVYIGTYTDHGSKGIYAYRFDAKTGQSTALGLAAESAQPSFLAVDAGGRFLYAVNEIESYEGQATGAVSAFAIDAASGKLSLLNQVSSRDGGPAHIALDRTGKYAIVSNYTRGSVAVFPVLKDGRLGEASSFVQHHGTGADKERQEQPHAHAVAMSSDNRFALVADLGLDQVFAYPFDSAKGTLGQKPHVTKTNAGAGPRHLVFNSEGNVAVRDQRIAVFGHHLCLRCCEWRVERIEYDL